MMTAPNPGIVPAIVSPYSAGPLLVPAPVLASGTWTASNRALYYPAYLPHPCTAVKVWWWNGATASGNVDCGIYDSNLAKLVSSGLVAQAGTSVLQEFNITDTNIPSGLVYVGMMMDNTTGTVFRSAANTNSIRAQGWAQEATGGTLPATATLASINAAFAPVFGFSLRTLVA